MIKPSIPKNAKLVFKGQFNEFYQWEQPLYDGTLATFERIKRPDTVKVVPVLPNKKLILLHEEQPSLPPFVGFPGGRVDPGEDPLAAAKRELREETGYTAKRFDLWLQFYPSSGMVWELFFYIAKDLEKVGDLKLDGGEKITLEEITFEQFLSIPNNPDYFDFRGGGFFNETLIRAQYDRNEREKLQRAFYT